MTETKTDLGITNNSFTFVNEDYEETLDNILLPNDIANSHKFCLNIGFLSFLCSILTIALLQVFYIFFLISVVTGLTVLKKRLKGKKWAIAGLSIDTVIFVILLILII